MLYCGRWRTTLTKLTSIASPSPPLAIFTDINNNWQRVKTSQRESRQTCAKTPTLPKVQQISVSTKGNTWSCLVNLGKYHPSKESASYVQLRYPNPLYVISQHLISSIYRSLDDQGKRYPVSSSVVQYLEYNTIAAEREFNDFHDI